MPLSLEKKLPIILLLVFLTLVAIGFFAHQSRKSLEESVGWQKHTQQVLLKLDETLLGAVDLETGARGFIIGGTENFLEPYTSGRARTRQAFADLKRLTADNRAQDDNIAQLGAQLEKKIAVTDEYVRMRRTDGLLNSVNELSKGEGDVLMNQIRQTVQRMREEENRLLKFREANLETTLGGNFWLMAVSSLAGIGALALANFVVLFEIRKRRGAEHDLVEANQSLEKRVEERTEELRKVNESLRQSELFRRSVIDSLSAHIAVLDREGNIVLVNEAWENFAEANAAVEQLSRVGIGVNYLTICESEEAGESRIIAENLRAILAGERQSFTIEYPCHSPVEERWFLMQVNALQSSDGGVVVSHYNITDRVKAENNEKAARREAEIANRLRDEFMATVSHELRTPLNAILGWAKILAGGRLDEDRRGKAVETIIKNAETQNRLITDLLDVARLISGKLILDLAPVAPDEWVTTSVETIKPAAAEKGIAVALDRDARAAACVIDGDIDRLRQILLNLLTNAVKFTPEGGRVEVALGVEKSEIVVRVSDNGAGISPEFLPHVFERFRQDAALLEKSGGLGLGLAIVRQLTEMHGGTVGVESDGEGRGATFTVRLPARAREVSE